MTPSRNQWFEYHMPQTIYPEIYCAGLSNNLWENSLPVYCKNESHFQVLYSSLRLTLVCLLQMFQRDFQDEWICKSSNMSMNLHQFWDNVVGSIGLRCLAGVYPGPVVPSPPVDRRPVEDVEQEEEHLDYYRYYMWLGNAVIIAPQVL